MRSDESDTTERGEGEAGASPWGGGTGGPGGGASRPPIPVLRLARHAYLDLIGSWRGFAGMAAPWVVVPWLLLLPDQPFLELVADLGVTVGFAAVSVAWYRRILLNEPVPERYAPLRPEVGRFMGFSVVVILAATLPSILLALFMAGGTGEGPPQGAALLLVVAAPLGLLAAMRLQTVFPAAAIGDRAVTLRTAWEGTRGNTWRMLLGVVLASLPPAVAGIGLALLLGWLADATGSLVLRWLASLAPLASAAAQSALMAAFLSYVRLYLGQPHRAG